MWTRPTDRPNDVPRFFDCDGLDEGSESQPKRAVLEPTPRQQPQDSTESGRARQGRQRGRPAKSKSEGARIARADLPPVESCQPDWSRLWTIEVRPSPLLSPCACPPTHRNCKWPAPARATAAMPTRAPHRTVPSETVPTSHWVASAITHMACPVPPLRPSSSALVPLSRCRATLRAEARNAGKLQRCHSKLCPPA